MAYKKSAFIIILITIMFLTSCKTNNTAVRNEVMLKNGEKTTEDEIITACYVDKQVKINYPQLINSNDNAREEINELIKNEALKVLNYYDGDIDQLSLEINYEIGFQDTNLLSIQYSGIGYNDQAAHPNKLFYTTNLNIEEVKIIRLSDVINIDKTFVDEFLKYKVEAPEFNEASVTAFVYIKEYFTTDDLIGYFDDADSSFEQMTFTYSYFTEHALGISLEVPFAVGGHIEVELSFEDIKDNFNTKSVVWNEVLNLLDNNKN